MSAVSVLLYSEEVGVTQSAFSKKSVWKIKIITDSRQGDSFNDFLSNICFESLEEAEDFAKKKKYNYKVAKPSKIEYNLKSYVDIITREPSL